MCPQELSNKLADSCWSSCSFLYNSLIQKNSMWNPSEKFLHQDFFRFKNWSCLFIKVKLRISKIQTAFQNSERPTVIFVPAQNELSGATICSTPHKVDVVNHDHNCQQENTGTMHYWLSDLQFLFYGRLRCCSDSYFACKLFVPPSLLRGLILFCLHNFKIQKQV